MKCELCGHEHMRLVGWQARTFIWAIENLTIQIVYGCPNCKHPQLGEWLSQAEFERSFVEEMGDDWKPADFSAGWEV